MSSKAKSSGAYGAIFNVVAIVLSLVAAWAIVEYIMGNPVNFEKGNPDGSPLPGNYLGIIYKGGKIVPLLIACILVLLTFSIERAFTLARAQGKGRLNVFVKNLQNLVASGNLSEGIDTCDKQKGCLANVLKAGLVRYGELQKDTTLENDQKVIALQKNLKKLLH